MYFRRGRKIKGKKKRKEKRRELYSERNKKMYLEGS